MRSFSAKIFKLGINPCVNVPERILDHLFRAAGKRKGPIPVRGTLNRKKFKQTVVRYKGSWRLYLNSQIRRESGIDVGDEAVVQVEYDPDPRIVPMNATLRRALAGDREAKTAFGNLPPSRRKEILRYLESLKSGEAMARTVGNVIQQLTGRRTKKLSFLLRRSKNESREQKFHRKGRG